MSLARRLASRLASRPARRLTSLGGGGGGFNFTETPTLAQVEAIRTAGRGIQSQPTKLVGVDTLPTGAAISGDFVNVTGTGVTFDGWDFNDYRLSIRDGAVVDAIENCRFTEPNASGWIRMMDVYAGSRVDLIRYCDFQGAGYLGEAGSVIGMRTSGSGLSATAPDVRDIQRCAFWNYPSDGIKSTSPGLIRWNYFDGASNLPYEPPVWLVGETYQTGDIVQDGTYVYRSLIDDNIGNALPTGKTDNASWENLDPHADDINPYAVIGGPLEIYGNYVNQSNVFRLLGSGWGWGLNNALRLAMNTGSDLPHLKVTAHHNIFAGGSGSASYPVQMESGDGHDNYVPDAVVQNWIEPNSGDLMVHPDWEDNAGNVFDGNIEYDQAAAIAVPLTARRSVLFPSRNGTTQGVRFQAPQLSNWMRTGSTRQAGALMLDVLVQDDASISGSTVQATKVVASTGTSATNGQWSLTYRSSNNTAGQDKRLQLYCRTNDMASAGDPALIVYSPQMRDGEQCTAFMVWSDTEMYLAMAWADGTVSTGTPATLPASFIGRVSPGAMTFGGSTNTSASFVNFFNGCLGRFAYLRGRVPTEAEMVRVAQGESPDSVFSGELDRYYPMSGPADLSPDVGSGDLVLQSVGTDVGYTLRSGGSLSGASNGTSGFTVDMPLAGHVWALDLDDYAAGAPVTLDVTNTLGASTEFDARAVLYSDGETVHKPWTRMTGGPVALDATATLTLPGVAWSELLHIEVRRADATSVTWCSGPCGVGPDIIDDGQSQRAIWGVNVTTDSTSLSAITITNPCVSVAYPPRISDGLVYPFIHRLIDTAIDTPIGPAAFAKRFAELTGNKVARIRSQSVEGSGRNLYTSNTLFPRLTNTGPYAYWGTVGTEGSGMVADHLLKCGTRFSAIIGHYSADDLQSVVFTDRADPYFFGTGSPTRHWGQVSNPIGLRVFLCLHDRAFRNSLEDTPTIIGGFYDAIRSYVTANSSSFTLAPPFTLDKRMGTDADEGHQSSDDLTGNARMSYRYASWLAGLLGVQGGLVNPGTLTSVASSSPFTSATCSFSIPSGASLAVSDGGTGVHGFEVNVAGGGWTRVTPANAQISGNTVVISNIVGASAASDIQVRYGYDHAWGTAVADADRFIEDNALIEQVLLTTVPDAPTEPEWAEGFPVMPSVGAVTAT